MYGCVLASTFGLTLIEIDAFISFVFAIRLMSNNSYFDSTLKHFILASSPFFISDSDLPTPEKMIFLGSPPA